MGLEPATKGLLLCKLNQYNYLQFHYSICKHLYIFYIYLTPPTNLAKIHHCPKILPSHFSLFYPLAHSFFLKPLPSIPLQTRKQ